MPARQRLLRTGTLTADGLRGQEEPVDARTPFLENRNVQFIRRHGTSDVVHAGIESALLRSTNAGAAYDFLVHYGHDAPKYPYSACPSRARVRPTEAG